MSKPWLTKVALFLLVVLVSACQQEDSPLPTTAPRIPTSTLTPIPSSTPTRTPFPGTLPPASDLDQPTWTPTTTSTQRPSPTAMPTLTSTPTPTPAEAASSIEALPDGAIRLNLLAADLTQANDLKVVFAVEPDALFLTFGIENPLLGQTSQISAQVDADRTPVQVTLMLRDFTYEGPQVTRAQVQEKIAEVADFLNSHVRSAFVAALEQETNFEILNVSLKANFIVVDMIAR